MRFFNYLILVGSLAFIFGCNQPKKNSYKISPPPSKKETGAANAAIKALSEAIRSSPSVPTNYFKRSVIYFNNRLFDEALKDIDRADELRPSQASYLLLKAKILKELNRYTEAITVIKRVESLNPEELDFYVTSAELAIHQKDTLLASSNIAKALKIAPFSAGPHFVKGLYDEQIRHDTLSAVASFYTTIRYDPNHRNAYSEIINYLKTENLSDSAFHMTDLAIRQFGMENVWKKAKAGLLANTGDYEQAFQFYNEIYTADSTDTDAVINLATTRINQKNYLSALFYLEKAISKDVDSANLLYLAGLCNEKMYAYSKAQLYYIKAVRKNPGMQEAVQGQERTTRIINGSVGSIY